jgi:hypothetical protein
MSFTRDITRFVEKSKVSADIVLRKIALDAFGRIITKSPVDTGRFRGNWNVAIGTADLSTTDEAPQKSKGTKKGQAPTGMEIAFSEGTILGAKFGDTIRITNNLPYALRIENESWSGQAPSGVLKISFDEIRESIGASVASVRRGGTSDGGSLS